MTRDAIARELYDALLAARVYVKRAAEATYLGESAHGQVKATELLDRVDGVLADAGELLQGVTS